MAFDPLTSILDIGGKLIDKLIPDPQAKAAAQLELLKLQQTGDLAQLAAETDLMKGQLAINQVEAASSNIFVSGWRPFIGWVCGAGIGYAIIIEPFATWFAKLCGSKADLPHVDTSMLLPLVTALLGLGAMRSWEKVRGVSPGDSSGVKKAAVPR